MGLTARTLTIGHTPDLDDAFMFYALAQGKVRLDGLDVEHVIEDIQTLNQRALTGELEVTAISASNYPAVAADYWILSVGSSVGQDYGPVVVASTACSPEELRGKRIGVPGLQTTAYLLLRLAIGECVPVPMSFERIPQAVLDGAVDAGLLIHERQLTYHDQGLLPILDVGTWWHKRMRLPLPLGLNVVKRSLGRELAEQFATCLRESILYAMAHQDDAMAYSMSYGRGIDPVRARQFIGMYVNEETLLLSPAARQALQELLTQAHHAGLIATLPSLDYIEPRKN